MDAPAPQDIHASIDAAFGSEVERDVNSFSSGAVSVTIRDQGRVALIDGPSDGEWGVSIDPDDTTATADHDDHDTVAISFEVALDIAHDALRAS
ncbi:hypothetical protein [Salinactinospora qingdaonensis]|uniref:Uncharacterized protein n=1 Tax=Salinactinospora qingdaonensis TaxID=702744 RepID=A0ABP7GKD1_9ACTN